MFNPLLQQWSINIHYIRYIESIDYSISIYPFHYKKNNRSVIMLVMHNYVSGYIPLKRVKYNTQLEHEYISNFKVLQNCFAKLGVDKVSSITPKRLDAMSAFDIINRLVKCCFSFALLLFFSRHFCYLFSLSR